MVAQWIARWGLLAAGVVAVVVTVVSERRKGRKVEPKATDDEIAAAPVEA